MKWLLQPANSQRDVSRHHVLPDNRYQDSLSCGSFKHWRTPMLSLSWPASCTWWCPARKLVHKNDVTRLASNSDS